MTMIFLKIELSTASERNYYASTICENYRPREGETRRRGGTSKMISRKGKREKKRRTARGNAEGDWRSF